MELSRTSCGSGGSHPDTAAYAQFGEVRRGHVMPIVVGLLPESVGRQRDHETRGRKRGMMGSASAPSGGSVPGGLRGRRWRVGTHEPTAATDTATATVVVGAAGHGRRGSRPRDGSERRGRRGGQCSGDEGNR